eukprot:6751428-Pyramimonas_sp.AAC.1
MVHNARPWICPNLGFRLQLEELERLDCNLSKWRAWRHVYFQLSRSNSLNSSLKSQSDTPKGSDSLRSTLSSSTLSEKSNTK